MVKNAYGKGARFENDVKNLLEGDFPIVIRAAGSHGAIDIIAIRKGEAWIIQCRTGGQLTKDEVNELVMKANELTGHTEFIPCRAYKDEGKVVIERLKFKPKQSQLKLVDGKFTMEEK